MGNDLLKHLKGLLRMFNTRKAEKLQDFSVVGPVSRETFKAKSYRISVSDFLEQLNSGEIKFSKAQGRVSQKGIEGFYGALNPNKVSLLAKNLSVAVTNKIFLLDATGGINRGNHTSAALLEALKLDIVPAGLMKTVIQVNVLPNEMTSADLSELARIDNRNSSNNTWRPLFLKNGSAVSQQVLNPILGVFKKLFGGKLSASRLDDVFRVAALLNNDVLYQFLNASLTISPGDVYRAKKHPLMNQDVAFGVTPFAGFRNEKVQKTFVKRLEVALRPYQRYCEFVDQTELLKKTLGGSRGVEQSVMAMCLSGIVSDEKAPKSINSPKMLRNVQANAHRIADLVGAFSAKPDLNGYEMVQLLFVGRPRLRARKAI